MCAITIIASKSLTTASIFINRDGHHIARDAMALFPHLAVKGDDAHAFYLGTELMKAELAFNLGKRYVQDEPLDFGVATERAEEDRDCVCATWATPCAQKRRLECR